MISWIFLRIAWRILFWIGSRQTSRFTWGGVRLDRRIRFHRNGASWPEVSPLNRYVGEEQRESQGNPRNGFGCRNVMAPSAEPDDKAVFEKENRKRVTPRHPLTMLLDLAA